MLTPIGIVRKRGKLPLLPGGLRETLSLKLRSFDQIDSNASLRVPLSLRPFAMLRIFVIDLP
jgi:hypothetical protein